MSPPREHLLRVRWEPVGPSDASRSEAAAEKQYYYLQDLVTGYNEDCLEIKKWSVTTASIVAVIGQLGLRYLQPVLILIIALAVGFWITETIWRMNQWAFIRVINAMEAANTNSPQIGAGWRKFYLPAGSEVVKDRPPERSLSGFASNFFALITMLPHAVIVGFAGVALVAVRFHPVDLGDDKTKPLSGALDITLHPAGNTQ